VLCLTKGKGGEGKKRMGNEGKEGGLCEWEEGDCERREREEESDVLERSSE